MRTAALLTVLLAFVARAQEAPAPDQQNAQQARAVLDQAISALGGSAYLNWQDLTTEGRSYSFHRGEPNSLGTLFWRFRKFPDKDRIEITKKRDIVQIFTGDQAYEITFKGVRQMDDKEEIAPYMRRRHFSLDSVLRGWLKEPGIALFYEGRKVAAQKETDQVTVMNNKNEAVTVNFDISSHLPVRKSFAWRDPTDKQRNVEEEIYDNYRNSSGIMTPFDLTRMFNGEMAAQFFLTSAAYNQGLADNLFDPHAAGSTKKR